MLAQGYRPVPVLRFDSKDKAAGKRPTLPEWQTVCEAADETEIRRWARDSGQRNCLNTGMLAVPSSDWISMFPITRRPIG